MTKPQVQESERVAQMVRERTCGDPPDRDCLPGSDEKWAGYLLGVEEAIEVMLEVEQVRGTVLAIWAERDRYREALDLIAGRSPFGTSSEAAVIALARKALDG